MIKEYAPDIIEVLFILCIIYAILSLVWSSTYVREPIIPSATMVVIQEQTSLIQSTETTSEILQADDSSQPSEVESQLRKRDVMFDSTENGPSTSSNSIVTQTTDEVKSPLDNDLSLNNQSNEVKNLLFDDSSSVVQTDEVDTSLLDNKALVVNQTDEIESSLTLSNSQSADTDEVENDSIIQHNTEDQSSNIENNSESVIPNPNRIKIKLKYVDDTQKEVYGDLDEEVGSFKRNNFDVQMTPNTVVKLIFNGRVLTEDTSTLAHYGLFDNCVVHCLISQRIASQQRTSVNDAYSIDISELYAFMIGGVLAFLWYLFMYHNEIFNFPSTISLLFITGMVLVTYNPFSHLGPLIDDIYFNYIIDSFLPVLGINYAPRQDQNRNPETNQNVQ